MYYIHNTPSFIHNTRPSFVNQCSTGPENLSRLTDAKNYITSVDPRRLPLSTSRVQLQRRKNQYILRYISWYNVRVYKQYLNLCLIKFVQILTRG